MSAQDIELLKFIWEVVKGTAVALWVVIPLIVKWVLPWIEDRRYRRLVPSQPGAKALVRLVKLLGQVQSLLTFSEHVIVKRIRQDLLRVQWTVWTEAWPYAAIYSKREKERCSAMRNLSQGEGQEAMDRATEIIRGIVTNPWTSKKVKEVGEAALDELRRRREMASTETGEAKIGKIGDEASPQPLF